MPVYRKSVWKTVGFGLYSYALKLIITYDTHHKREQITLHRICGSSMSFVFDLLTAWLDCGPFIAVDKWNSVLHKLFECWFVFDSDECYVWKQRCSWGEAAVFYPDLVVKCRHGDEGRQSLISPLQSGDNHRKNKHPNIRKLMFLFSETKRKFYGSNVIMLQTVPFCETKPVPDSTILFLCKESSLNPRKHSKIIVKKK